MALKDSEKETLALFLSTTLGHLRVYPDVCFTRGLRGTTHVYHSASPALTAYLADLVDRMPLPTALRVSFYRTPLPERVLDVYVLPPFAALLDAAAHVQRLPPFPFPVTFSVAAVTSLPACPCWAPADAFFGDRASLEPIADAPPVLVRAYPAADGAPRN